MRSNGLTASSYLPVADVNPTVAEALFDDLRARGIAAYAEPVNSPSVSGFDRPEYRVEVLVRLYVDAAATEQALRLVTAVDPSVSAPNDDLTWAQIVAGYDAPTSAEAAPWPAYEDLDPDHVHEDDQSSASFTVSAIEQAAALREEARRAAQRREARRSEEEDRFVPPPPPPLPRLSAADQVAWLGLIGGPVVLIAAALFSLSLPAWLTLLAALGFIGGFVTLVIRMDDGSTRLDDPDDGAQV